MTPMTTGDSPGNWLGMLSTKIKLFNDALAGRLTLLVSTMGCVYLFTLWALLPLVVPHFRDVVFYISGGILQLSLLPLIMVGQNVLNRNSEVRAEQDHAAVLEILTDIKEVLTEDRTLETSAATELGELGDIMARLARIETRLDDRRSMPG